LHIQEIYTILNNITKTNTSILVITERHRPQNTYKITPRAFINYEFDMLRRKVEGAVDVEGDLGFGKIDECWTAITHPRH
jgi:hypothetical protein